MNIFQAQLRLQHFIQEELIIYDSDYSDDRFKKMKEELRGIPVTVALSASAFFLTGLMEYLPNVLKVYSRRMRGMKLKEMEGLRLTLLKLTESEGSKNYINGMISSLTSQGETL